MGVDHIGGHDADADGAGDVNAENEKGDEIKERRPDHGIAWPQHARRHKRSYRVGRIVQTVEEIESQCNKNEADQEREIEAGAHDQQRSQLIDNDRIYLVGDVLEPVDHLFQMVV